MDITDWSTVDGLTQNEQIEGLRAQREELEQRHAAEMETASKRNDELETQCKSLRKEVR